MLEKFYTHSETVVLEHFTCYTCERGLALGTARATSVQVCMHLPGQGGASLIQENEISLNFRVVCDFSRGNAKFEVHETFVNGNGVL